MAELVLKAIAQPLAGRDRPRGTSIAAWESWWKELLGTDPFPAVDIAPGGVRPVARLAMNQTHPEVSASPAGNRVVISVSRLEQPEHGVRSGIRLIEPGAPREDDFVYKLADCEPDSLAVGWDGVSAAVVWQECRYGPPRGARVKFMLLDDAKRKGEPVRLKLRRVDHMKIAPFRKNTWLLAAAVDPKPGSDGDIEEWKRAVTLFVLSAKGRVIRSVPRVQLPKNPAYGMRDGVVINAVAVTSRGPALAVNIPEEGLYLIFLDWKLRTRRSVQVNDPANDGHEFSAGLGVNGDKLCVAWRESDNHDDRLFVRTFDANGTPLSAGHLLSSYAGILADPIAAGDGFEIIWTDFSQTRNQVRIATVHAGGKPTASRCVHISRDWISVLGAGHANGVTRVFARDTQYYPHWLWQKDVSTDPK